MTPSHDHCPPLEQHIAANLAGSPIWWLDCVALQQQAAAVLAALPTPYYAVKANSHPTVLRTLAAAGIRRFDIASVAELQRVQQAVPNVDCAFMNPFKPEPDIRVAWQAGVRLFALDSAAELDKLLRATGGGPGACLLVRLACTDSHADWEMSGKFGASDDEAMALLQRVAGHGMRCGLTFHIGSQCEQPARYARMLRHAAALADRAGVVPEIIDIGGGFAARYRGDEPPLDAYRQAITGALQQARPLLGPATRLHSEPGRCLVAGAASVAVRVEARKGDLLILNDGKHGLLSELWWMPARHPVRRLGLGRQTGPAPVPMQDFALAGPTCDSGDLFRGPYRLPADTAPGDWLAIGCLGAYSLELATPFNGMGRHRILTSTQPLATAAATGAP